MKTGLAIYVHWPWCKAKCPYCDFNSHAGTPNEQSYLNGILSEFRLYTNNHSIHDIKTHPFGAPFRVIESLFFGGGTPSLMHPESIRQVIEAAGSLGVLTPETEITVECNPTSFESPSKALEFFNNLKHAGVNRVSIGLQGLEQDWLTFLGRSHSVQDALATLDAAQTVIGNVNADIIYGLPEQALDAWVKQLEMLSQRGLQHISAYQLTIEKNTRFYHDVKRGLWEPIPSDLEADFFEATQGVLQHNGYQNYEISNFAKPGFACRHNVHVWRYGDYVGIGAGAHGRLTTADNRTIATQVIRQPEGYLRRTSARQSPLLPPNLLTPPEAAQEAIFSGLRLFEGIDMESILKRFGSDAYQEAISVSELQFLVDHGLLEMTPTHLRLTPDGWARLNAVLERLLRVLPPSTPLPPPSEDHQTSEYTGRTTVTFE